MQTWPALTYPPVAVAAAAFEIRVREDDQRAVRAELEREALDPRDAADLLPHRRRAREADLPHPRIGTQRGAELGSRARDHLDRVLRQPGVEQRARQEDRRQRRLPCRLENHGVARRKRRSHLVGDEQRGEVERRDRDDDAARLAQGERELAGTVRGRVDRNGLAVQARPLGRARPQERRDPGGLASRLDERLADLRRDRAGELLEATLEQVRGAPEDVRPLEGGEPAHHPRAVDGGRDRPLGVVAVRHRDGADRLAVERAAHLLLTRPLRPCTGDVHHRLAPAAQRPTGLRATGAMTTMGSMTPDSLRLPSGHGLERGPAVSLTLDGRAVTAYEGESVAALLLAEGHAATRLTQGGEPQGRLLRHGCVLRLPRRGRRRPEHPGMRDVGA